MSHRPKLDRKLLILIGLFFVLAIWSLTPSAQAGWLEDTASEAATSVILFIQGLLMQFIGSLLGVVAHLLATFLKTQSDYFSNITIVQTSWEVFRDFANMFFILILVVIAFATILDIPRYNWRGLLAPFLIAALLINFSLAIGGFIINVSNNLSAVMLNQFADITQNLAAGFGLNELSTPTINAGQTANSVNLGGNVVAATVSTIISMVGMLVMTGIALCSFVAALIFSIVRVPVLWALLIVSPLAWISMVLPNTRHIWSKWWHWFFGWTFFLPAYLFTLVMGIAILNNRPDLRAATQMLAGQPGVADEIKQTLGFGIQSFFFYILTVIIMLGGLIASLKFSFLAGTGVTTAFGKISGGVNTWARNKSGVTAGWKAGKERLAEVQEKGLPGKMGMLYGGQRAQDVREARMREHLGLVPKGAAEATKDAHLREDIDKATKEFSDRNLARTDVDALLATRLTDARRIALAKMRAENGWVPRGADGQKEIEETVRMLGDPNTKASKDYVNTLIKNNFTDVFGSQAEMESFVRSGSTSTVLRKAGLETMAKNNNILSEDLVAVTLDLFSEESKEKREAIEKDLQKNIKNFARDKKDRSAYLLDSSKDSRTRKMVANQMSEDGEINSYEKYYTAAELFGGEKEAASRDMRGKINTKDKITGTEIDFREELGRTDPIKRAPSYATNLEETETLITRFEASMLKMGPKDIAAIDKDKWNSIAFQKALQEKVFFLQDKNRPSQKPALNKSGEPLYKKDGKTPAQIDIPGGGELMKNNLVKLLENEPDKLNIVKNLKIQEFKTP